MRKYLFPRIHGPDYDLCIRSMYSTKSLIISDIVIEALSSARNKQSELTKTNSIQRKAKRRQTYLFFVFFLYSTIYQVLRLKRGGICSSKQLVRMNPLKININNHYFE